MIHMHNIRGCLKSLTKIEDEKSSIFVYRKKAETVAETAFLRNNILNENNS